MNPVTPNALSQLPDRTWRRIGSPCVSPAKLRFPVRSDTIGLFRVRMSAGKKELR